MENASKALIIAGAILLSILIIGLGMFIYNGASETLDKTASRMSEQEKQTHNQRFQKFAGDRRSGTDVKSLLNEIIQNHATQVQNGEMMRSPAVNFIGSGSTSISVALGAEATGNEFNNMMANVKTTRTYKVDINLDAKTGIVDTITITEQ